VFVLAGYVGILKIGIRITYLRFESEARAERGGEEMKTPAVAGTAGE
jgi:hypothetical protein